MRLSRFHCTNSRLPRLLLAAGALSLALATHSYADVTLTPGQDVQAAVNSNYPGTTFIFSTGLYRGQSIIPKQGDIFVGQPGVYLNGSTILTNFSQNGVYYLATVKLSAVSAPGSCLSDRPGCTYPEDLFLDGRRLERVTAASAVAAGKWFLDYSTGAVYMVDSPFGHLVQLSTSRFAFGGNASGVVIRGLHIQKYANPAQKGAIEGAAGLNWTIQQNEVSYNHGAGLHLGGAAQVLNNYIHHNGQIGMSGGGNDILIQNNEIAYNNTAGYDWSWQSGGAKLTTTNRLVVRGNYVHDNVGPGFITDYNNYNTLYESNHTARNIAAGIMHEVSFSAIIRYNQIESDGFNPRGGSAWWGSGIRILASSDVEIYGNTLVKCMNGIIGIQTDRGAGYQVQNLNVHDNVITQATGIAAGIVTQSQFSPAVFTSSNNHLDYNTYHVTSLTGAYFAWDNRYLPITTWQSYGNDVNGTLLLP